MVGAVCTLPMWPCLLLAWQHLVSSGELGDSRVWLGHLPGLEQFVEIWDTRNAEPIVEWRAYFLPSPFPRQINLLSTEWTPYDFHEKVYRCICPTGRAGRVIKIQISHLFAWLVAMMEMYKERFYSVFCGELRITHSADTRMANNKILYNVNLFLSSMIDMVADYKETAAPLVTLFLLSAAVPVCLLIRPTVPLSQSMITQNISSIFHIVYLYICVLLLFHFAPQQEGQNTGQRLRLSLRKWLGFSVSFKDVLVEGIQAVSRGWRSVCLMFYLVTCCCLL